MLQNLEKCMFSREKNGGISMQVIFIFQFYLHNIVFELYQQTKCCMKIFGYKDMGQIVLKKKKRRRKKPLVTQYAELTHVPVTRMTQCNLRLCWEQRYYELFALCTDMTKPIGNIVTEIISYIILYLLPDRLWLQWCTIYKYFTKSISND